MGEDAQRVSKIEVLKDLEKAVEEQNYEQAAILRDQIKEAESEVEKND